MHLSELGELVTRSHCLFQSLFCVGLLVPLAGCGNSGPQLAPVSGKATVNGKELPRGSISLRPDKAQGNTAIVEPYGDIDGDGNFSILTDKKPGAPLGKYIVLVTATEPVDPKNASATPKSLIHSKYKDPERPVLRFEVVETPEAGRYDLSLEK
jgi:predicted small lipoprotein YifL